MDAMTRAETLGQVYLDAKNSVVDVDHKHSCPMASCCYPGI